MPLNKLPRGPGVILTSPNGEDWTVAHTNRLAFFSVAGADGKIVVTADGGAVLVSTNLFDWQTANGTGTNTLAGITYGNGLWVAGGGYGAVIKSSDAINWSETQIQGRADYYLRSLAYAQDRFVAAGRDSHFGTMFWSQDGTFWEAVRLPRLLASHMFGVKYADGHFLATGASGRVFVSTNGMDWSRSTPNDSSWTGYDITFAQGRFLVPIRDGVLSSKDGVYWRHDYFFKNSSPVGLLSVAFGDGKYVAVGVDGRIFYAEGSLPFLDSVVVRVGTAILSFSGGTEARYAVEAAPSLASPVWTRIGEALAVDGVGTFEDKNAGQFPQRYYRLTSP